MRTKLQKLQHDPTLTPPTSPVDLQPKQLINQHDYHTITQSKVHDQDHDTYTNSHSAMQQQIRLDDMLLRQIQPEEQNISMNT